MLTYIYLKKKLSFIIGYLQRQSGADDAQRWGCTQGMQLKIGKVAFRIIIIAFTSFVITHVCLWNPRKPSKAACSVQYISSFRSI